MSNFRLGVLVSLDISIICCNVFSRLSQTFWMASSLTSYSRPNARLLNTFGLLNFAMISHHWASVKWVVLGFIRFPLRFIKSEGLESDMSKVHTYQLSAHQWIQSAYLNGTILYMLARHLWWLHKLVNLGR